MTPLIVGVFLLASSTNLSTTTYNSVYRATSTPISSSTIKSLIRAYSAFYEVSYDTLYSIIGCETGHTFNPLIQSLAYRNGIQEDSWGLAQINLPSWKGIISKEQAQDPDFAITFMAKKISQGKIYLWSCAKILGLTG